MDELPAVLQKEIWEYVRGDRSFWKSKMDQVLPKVYIGGRQFVRISRRGGNATIRLVKDDDGYDIPFSVWLCLNDEFVHHCTLFRGDFVYWFRTKEEAMVCFDQYVKRLNNGEFAKFMAEHGQG
jgi:hypothetical protein